jgi:hypothetical protein
LQETRRSGAGGEGGTEGESGLTVQGQKGVGVGLGGGERERLKLYEALRGRKGEGEGERNLLTINS